ncbi:uncharacterized protein EV422DRAFT_264373 [Fimicolochytrium jonesii]|uniref:uncharacterized protein n=1 Tax=Fimicolochytrium jonesii TaxID=1396493 RepID=UPI0022FEB59A|nr:uncharacterized protein EV422DRAFT_264373 [Fimicolochytrium jonesii]KAI8817092.1 hypothetical protein EV422DRAFT_264373 [Fimicolochytrium jonesii]
MELSTIGLQCSAQLCNRLDFLPFKCSACLFVFCLEHRTPSSHACAKWTEKDKHLPVCPLCSNILSSTPGVSDTDILNAHQSSKCTTHITPTKPSEKITCGMHGCGKRELWGVKCRKCSHAFCLQHRHPSAHACTVLARELTVKKEKDDALAGVTGTKRTGGTKVGGASDASGKKTKLSPAVELMRLKMHAKGDASIPVPSRTYLSITSTTEPALSTPTPMFFHKDWTVGRCVDYIASALKITNVNNTGNRESLLALYDAEGRRLGMGESVGTVGSGRGVRLERGVMESVDVETTP